MRISVGAELDLDSFSRGLDLSLSAIDADNDYDILHISSVGWAVPLTLIRQDWKDFLFMVSRGKNNFYGCILGFYVRHLGDPD